MSWKTLHSKIILKNKFFNIQKDRCQKTDGNIIDDYYTVNRPDVAIIAAFTSNSNLILIHQYRHPVHSLDYELPAGYIEPNENNIIEAANRELLEETGYKTNSLEKIQETYASAGFMSNKVHFFIGFNAKKIATQKLDNTEELDVNITPWEKTLEYLKNGKIKDLGSVTGILLANNYLKKHKIKL